ncbi:MAG TPA: hypothetical protein VIY49_24070 [Bryobacteraceae bacterium]
MKPALLLFAALPVLFTALLIACSHPAPPGPKIDPALYGMIPPDTVLLAGARVEAIEKTPVYKKDLAERDFPAVDRFAETMHIDPRKDLWELLFVSNGERSAVLGRGMFSDESEPRLPGRRFGYRGFNMVGGDDTAILLIGPTAVAIGDTAELKAMVDAHDSSPGAPPSLAAVLRGVPAESQLWAAFAGGPLRFPIPATGNLSNLNNIVRTIQSGSFYVDLRMGLSGAGVGACRNQKEAQDLEGGLQALIGLGRFATPKNKPELQKLWEGVRVTQQSSVVRLSIDEPEDLVDAFFNLTMGSSARPKK